MSNLIDYLLHEEEVLDALNASDDFQSFLYHWDNYELTYVHDVKPTPKLFLALKDAHKANSLGKNYHEHWSAKVLRIVEKKQWEKIEGCACDMTTANAVKTVLENLSEKNLEKFKSMSFPVAVGLTWKILGECKQ